MRLLVWPLRILVFLVLFAFALKNTNPVTLRFYGIADLELPLAVLLLLVFVAGVATGIAVGMPSRYRQRREILSLRKDARGVRDATSDAG